KVIFWNTAKNGWTVLWWDNEDKKLKTRTEREGEKPKYKCEECGILMSGDNVPRHYRRKHPNINPPKNRKSPTKKTGKDNKAREKLEEFCKTIDDNNVFDIPIA